jgi:hypothetical protein
LLQDGRYFERKSADLHHSAGLDCIDCHTALEVMGSGHSVANKAQALRVRCEDCHAAPGGKLASRDAKDIDPESRKILALRGWKLPPGQRVGATRSGDTLLNVTVDAAGRGTLRRKGDGGLAPLKPQVAACSGNAAHQRLSCNSCHTPWAPQCTSCHTRFDPSSVRPRPPGAQVRAGRMDGRRPRTSTPACRLWACAAPMAWVNAVATPWTPLCPA